MKELTSSMERIACSQQSRNYRGTRKATELNLARVSEVILCYLRKFSFAVGLLTTASLTANAQGLTIGAGTTASTGGASLYLSGNWIDEGTFDGDTGTVVFNGAGRQTVSDAFGETFYNMIIDGSSDTVELLDDITVNDTALVIAGNLNENGYKLTLGPHGVLVASKGDISLAVQATDFVATSSDGSVTLSWSTQSEVNLAGFDILREDPHSSSFKIISSFTSNDSLRGLGTSSVGLNISQKDTKNDRDIQRIISSLRVSLFSFLVALCVIV